MTINKWLILILVSCILQSNCMKRKLETDIIDNETDSNKKILLDNINAKNEKQLIKACQDADLNTIESLITPNNANTINNENGYSLLMINASRIWCDYDESYYNYCTPAEKSKIKEEREKEEDTRLQIAKCLIKNGADINIESPEGDTALIEAISVRNSKMTHLLLEYNIRFNDGDIYHAIHTPRLLKILIDAGISLNDPDLLKTCVSEETIKMLIWNGAKVSKWIDTNSNYLKQNQIHQNYKNKINQKYDQHTEYCNNIILLTMQNYLHNDLIPIIHNYYVEDSNDILAKRYVLINNILFTKCGNDIESSTKLPANISEIIANYFLRISGTDLENYCNENI